MCECGIETKFLTKIAKLIHVSYHNKEMYANIKKKWKN